ncbi:MAG: hypothetical protein MHPSP_003222, partial [Paramarteilia canceri]
MQNSIQFDSESNDPTTQIRIPKEQITSARWLDYSCKNCSIRISGPEKTTIFDSISMKDFDTLQKAIDEYFGLDLQRVDQNINGDNSGQPRIEGNSLVLENCKEGIKEMFALPIDKMVQCMIQKSEMSCTFKSTGPVGLSEIKFHVLQDEDQDENAIQ